MQYIYIHTHTHTYIYIYTHDRWLNSRDEEKHNENERHVPRTKDKKTHIWSF